MAGEAQADAIAVRVLAARDLELFERVEPDVFDYQVRREWALDALSDPRHVVAVALEGERGRERIVGMCTAYAYSHPDKPRQLFVNELGVAGPWRGRGIAGRMVEVVLARGRELGCVEAWVATELDNTPARRTYSKLAAREEPDHAVVYVWELAPGGLRSVVGDASE
ncbi:MAG: GNAT family N-acetyltransferase [Planctomycetes bacterium]|nr:GNAT family N-acetyltransferase [Planctomycetota bacterium]